MDELKMLAGLPIIVEPNVCMVYPLTLRQIAGIGLESYYKQVNFVTLSEADVKEVFAKLQITTISDMTGYDFIIENCLLNEKFYNEFKDAMRMVINESIYILEMDGDKVIAVGDLSDKRLLNRDNFVTLQNIVRAQNNMDIEQPLTDFERRMKEKFDKNRKLVAEAKEKEGKVKDDITFEVLVSSMAANCNNINIINVWDLTMYSFNDQFKRMQAVEEYQNGMDLICAGADPKKIKLKHYIRNILDTK